MQTKEERNEVQHIQPKQQHDNVVKNITPQPHMKKAYIISKDLNEDEMRIVKEHFEDPTKYLSLNSNLIVGILPFKPKNYIPNTLPHRPISSSQTNNNNINVNNNNNNNRPQTTSGIISGNHRKQPFTRPISSAKPRSVYNYNNNNNNHPRPVSSYSFNNPTTYYHNQISSRPVSSLTHYNVESKEQLINIFKESKRREEQFIQKGTDDLLNPTAQPNIKETFKLQEKLLKKINNHRTTSARISKNISKQSKRKEHELLMNRIEEHRIRQQMLDVIDNEKPIAEKHGNNHWMFSLRRPKYLDYVRVNYVNVGTPEKEIWKSVVEYPYKHVEILQNPESVVKDKYGNMIKIPYYNDEVKRCKCKVPNMKEINELKVEGKNLVEEEFKMFNDYGSSNSGNNNHLKLFIDPFEHKHKCVNEITYRSQYDRPTKEICKCKAKSNQK